MAFKMTGWSAFTKVDDKKKRTFQHPTDIDLDGEEIKDGKKSPPAFNKNSPFEWHEEGHYPMDEKPGFWKFKQKKRYKKYLKDQADAALKGEPYTDSRGIQRNIVSNSGSSETGSTSSSSSKSKINWEQAYDKMKTDKDLSKTYGHMTKEDYIKEAKRQSKIHKETGKWDVKKDYKKTVTKPKNGGKNGNKNNRTLWAKDDITPQTTMKGGKTGEITDLDIKAYGPTGKPQSRRT